MPMATILLLLVVVPLGLPPPGKLAFLSQALRLLGVVAATHCFQGNSHLSRRVIMRRNRLSESPTRDCGFNTCSPVHELILTRHGDSVWNGGQPGTLETFTGWTDVPLSEKGIQEAKDLGGQVATYSGGIDACFTSVLQRAQLTAHYCLWAFSSQPHTLAPQRYIVDYRLNERHYGSLQGKVKLHAEQSGDYNPKDVRLWRRSWHAVPPLLDDNDQRRQHELRKYLHYCGGSPEAVPRGESLAMVARNRIRPFIDDVLTPVLNDASASNGGTATGLIVAHANSLRALIGVLCNVEEGDRASLRRLEAIKIPTGVPLVLRYRPCPNRHGAYQLCEIPGLDHSTTNRPLPHLPLWPLSAIPRVRTESMIVQDSDPFVGEAAVIANAPRKLLVPRMNDGILAT